MLETWSGERTTEACQAAFEAAGVPSSPYRTVKEVLDDEQIAHRVALAEVNDPGGSFRWLIPPFRILRQRRSRWPVLSPALGQQTREILELAGYAADEIEKMSAAGIVERFFAIRPRVCAVRHSVSDQCLIGTTS